MEEDRLKKIEDKILKLEQKLDAVLNLLLQDLYEEGEEDVPFFEMESISSELGKLT